MKTFVLFCFLLPFTLVAQTDSEFWFVAPEVSSGHTDNPVVLRISAFSEATDVQISMPANAAFVPIQITITPNTSQTVQLTPFKETIENKPANTVLNKGLFVRASAPVTAYYEVAAGNNPDIFPLKGNNAKGREFYTPFQNYYNNGSYSPTPLSGFDIVATEDNTTITIVPTKNLVGHPAGQAFTITLNRGETWSGMATSTAAAEHPAGTHIVSDKPICITIKDDSMSNGGCRDLMGDQLIPIEHTGTDYIVMKGFLSGPDRVFVLATEDNTEVFIDGNATALGSLNRTEQLMATITNASTFIRASKPVYVLHITGFGCEMGGSVLPTIRCTGSSSVFFTRSTSESFGLNIMVKSGSEGSFMLNGSSTLIPASSFQPVTGTNGEWVSAQIQFNPQDIPVNVTSVVKNISSHNALFHLGVINGNGSGGCRYGYFSDFNAGVNFGGNKTVCLGDSVELNAGIDKDIYLWSTGDTLPFIKVNSEGRYWVTTSKEGCLYSDTVEVIEQAVNVHLGNDTSYCENQPVVLQPGAGYQSYTWQNGANTEQMQVDSSGTYFVIVKTFEGCSGSDTIVLTFSNPPPAPLLSGISTACAGDSLALFAEAAIGTLTFHGPSNFNGQKGLNILFPASASFQGEYWAFIESDGCRSDTSRINVVVHALPEPFISGDTLVCKNDSVTLHAGTGFTAYKWSNGSNNSSVKVPAGTYIVTVTNSEGCKGSAQVNVEEKDIQALFSQTPDLLNIPLNSEVLFADSSVFPDGFPPVNYFWDLGDGQQAEGPETNHKYSQPGTYTLNYIVKNSLGCTDTFSIELSVFDQLIIPNAFSPNADLQNDYFVIQYLESYKNPSLSIFNRWGKQVFFSDNYQNNWDGEGLPEGTYFYVLSIAEPAKRFAGTVYISGNK